MSETVSFYGRVTKAGDATKIDEATIAHFLISVGQRVRNARARKGISRRILSETSGVSQRYLAQLESGKGNISIGLLLRIAKALDFSMEWMVTEEDPWNSEVAMMRYLFSEATKEQRQRIIKILEPEHSTPPRANRIALIGLRGAGKSTLGRCAAEELGVTFLELNEEVEKISGMPVHEVFALYGQEGYRRLERQSLERVVATHDTLILAVAGGIVCEPETFTYFLRHYHTIWLKADAQDHMARVRGQGDERPMIGNPDAMKDLHGILTSRENLYSQADARVDTSNFTLRESLAKVLEVIEKNKFLSHRLL